MKRGLPAPASQIPELLAAFGVKRSARAYKATAQCCAASSRRWRCWASKVDFLQLAGCARRRALGKPELDML